MNKKYYTLVLLFSAVLFVIGYLYGINIDRNKITESESNIDLSGGSYIRMVYIGSSRCVYSNNSHTHKMVDAIKKRMENIFEETDVKFLSTGISTDRSSEDGLDFLKKSGPYDELLLGGGSFNLGVIKYVSGSTSTPKILFYLENFDTELVGLNMSNFDNSQKLIKMYNGQFEIEGLNKILKKSSQESIFKYFDLENRK